MILSLVFYIADIFKAKNVADKTGWIKFKRVYMYVKTDKTKLRSTCV